MSDGIGNGENFHLKAIVDMLVTAGYFRARILGLSPFDKIAGGMIWAISGSHHSVETNILFEENASIKQRIKTAETIVQAIIQLKCPYQIEPHQIHHCLDYPTIAKVIQWLVKNVLEYRKITGDVVRKYSVYQFNKSFGKFSEEQRTEKSVKFVNCVADRYNFKRLFRKQSNSTFRSKFEHIEATLLEYDEKILRFSQKYCDVENERYKKSNVQRNDLEDESVNFSNNDEKRINEIQRNLVEEKISRVSTLFLSENIEKEAIIYENRKKHDADLYEHRIKENNKFYYQRKSEALKQQLIELTNEHESKISQNDELRKRIETLTLEANKEAEITESLNLKIGKLHEIEQNPTTKTMFLKINNLVKQCELLKSSELELKQNFKKELLSLKDRIKNISEHKEGNTIENDRIEKIEQMYMIEKDKWLKIRELLTKTKQEISKNERIIDEIPTRAELLQYEHRFIELYELVAEKLKETKKYYSMYNTIKESYGYKLKEVSLLKSIQDEFLPAMENSHTRSRFLDSFNKTIEGITKSCQQVNKELKTENHKLDSVNGVFQKYIDKQRLYYKTLKEFQDECDKNEILENKHEDIKRIEMKFSCLAKVNSSETKVNSTDLKISEFRAQS